MIYSFSALSACITMDHQLTLFAYRARILVTVAVLVHDTCAQFLPERMDRIVDGATPKNAPTLSGKATRSRHLIFGMSSSVSLALWS